MYRFRVPEIFLGCFLTIAVFAAGMVFRGNKQPFDPAQSLEKRETSGERSSAASPDAELAGSTWLTKDAAGFFTFGLVVVGLGQALLFFFQLSYMRKGMVATATAAKAAADGAKASIEANAINRGNFLADHRPWLGPHRDIAFTRHFSPIKGGNETAIEVPVINAGRSPAFKVQIISEMYLMQSSGTLAVPERLKEKLASFSTWDSGGLIFPNNTVNQRISLTLTDDEVLKYALTIASQKTFYPMIWVGITYASNDGALYTTSALYMMRGAIIGEVIPHSQLTAGLMHSEAT
ncbi:hypothetical protein ABIF97_007908 [Bradyrhizobium japonicum]